MERAYNLEPHELQQQQQLSEEHQRALAEFGGLTLQMENVRTRIPQLEQKQRELVSAVAQRHGVTNFIAARIINRNLICQLPDEPVTVGPELTGRAVTSDCDIPVPGPVRSLRTNAHATVKE